MEPQSALPAGVSSSGDRPTFEPWYIATLFRGPHITEVRGYRKGDRLIYIHLRESHECERSIESGDGVCFRDKGEAIVYLEGEVLKIQLRAKTALAEADLWQAKLDEMRGGL